MITVTVNGKPRELVQPVGLVEFLTTHDIPKGLIAIAHNGVILKREEWAGILLSDGDRVEIVHMVGGGASI